MIKNFSYVSLLIFIFMILNRFTFADFGEGTYELKEMRKKGQELSRRMEAYRSLNGAYNTVLTSPDISPCDVRNTPYSNQYYTLLCKIHDEFHYEINIIGQSGKSGYKESIKQY